MTLHGLVALVTGGAAGIGLAITERLRSDGATVAVLDRDAPDPVDVRDETAVSRAVNACAKTYGRLDIVVAAAGGGSGGLADNRASQLSGDALLGALQLNLFGAVYTCTAAAPHLIQQGSGSIITIGSIDGLQTTQDGTYAHYGTAKAALSAYTRYLAQDLAPTGIRVNHVAPGPVSTDRLRSKYRAEGRDQAAGIPIGRAGRPDEIAQTVAFLCSPSSEFLTGATIAIHGGLVRTI